jgi:Xaa-Pro dipeptidase
MNQCDLDVLVATSPVNVTYFSDYFCWADPLFKKYMISPGDSNELVQRPCAVFPLEGEPALIVRSQLAVNALDSWVVDLHTYGDPGLDYSLLSDRRTPFENRFINLLRDAPRHATAADALVAVLKSRGLADARIGLEMEELPAQLKESLVRALPHALIRDSTNLIRIVRAVKSSEEIVRLTRSAEINEAAAIESVALARPGRPVADLVQHYRARVAELGANFDHFSFSIGGLGFCTEPKYLLQNNDVLMLDFGCVYSLYFSDSGTTLTTTHLSPPLLKKYEALRAAIEAGAETMRAGVKSSEIQNVMQETLKEHGVTKSYPHGHGLGLEIRDYPIIASANGLCIRDECIDVSSDLPMEEDMINNLEAAIFMPGAGVLQIEQTFIVTSKGSSLLVSQDRTKPRDPTYSVVS